MPCLSAMAAMASRVYRRLSAACHFILGFMVSEGLGFKGCQSHAAHALQHRQEQGCSLLHCHAACP